MTPLTSPKRLLSNNSDEALSTEIRSLIYGIPSDARWTKRGQRGYNMWRKGKRAFPRNMMNYEVVENVFDPALEYPDNDVEDELLVVGGEEENSPTKRSYKDWRKGKKRSYKDWRKGKRNHRNGVNHLFDVNRRTSGSQSFKQWRKMG